MLSKIFIHCAGCIGVVLLQLSFITTFPTPINSQQLLLCIVVFMTIIGMYRQALWWAWGGGLLLELFSPHFFGTMCVGLVISVIGAHYLFINFFTNFSFYSATVLSIVSSLWFAGLQVAIAYVSPVQSSLPSAAVHLWSYFCWQIVMNVLVVYALLVLMHYLTQRFSFSARQQHV